MANTSKTYFLPYMSDYIPIKYPTKILNTYLFYENEYKFCLLYTFSGKKSFIDYETELMNNEYFYKAIDIHPDKILYVFDIPGELYEILDLFIQGKYSYLPRKEKIKEFLILNFNLTRDHKIFHILDRTDELKKQMEKELNIVIPEGLDLFDPPIIADEEFNK